MVAFLMMSAKLTTAELLEITVFWSKGYEVIVPVHGLTNKVSSYGSSYNVDEVIWPKFGNSNIYKKSLERLRKV